MQRLAGQTPSEPLAQLTRLAPSINQVADGAYKKEQEE